MLNGEVSWISVEAIYKQDQSYAPVEDVMDMSAVRCLHVVWVGLIKIYREMPICWTA
eukprot:c28318_g1_i1 orf=28-198(+)